MTKNESVGVAAERLSMVIEQLKHQFGADVVEEMLNERVAELRRLHGDEWVDGVEKTNPPDPSNAAKVLLDDTLEEIWHQFGDDVHQRALVVIHRARTTNKACLTEPTENQDDH